MPESGTETFRAILDTQNYCLSNKAEIRGEFLEFRGISFGFPFFDFQPLKAWHSLHLGTEGYMTPPDCATLVA